MSKYMQVDYSTMEELGLSLASFLGYIYNEYLLAEKYGYLNDGYMEFNTLKITKDTGYSQYKIISRLKELNKRGIIEVCIKGNNKRVIKFYKSNILKLQSKSKTDTKGKKRELSEAEQELIRHYELKVIRN